MTDVKTFFIQAPSKPITETQAVQVPTGESSIGFFGNKKEVMRTEQQQKIMGYSNSAVDGFALVTYMHETIDPWLAQGYELFSITPITSGAYKHKSVASRSYGYGYSYTEGIMVVLKKT